jgi:VWFA-related protein
MKNFRKTIYQKLGLLIGLLAVILFISTSVEAQNKTSRNNQEKTILVTAVADNVRTTSIAERLQPTDFAVMENKRSQKIVSVKRAEEEPLILSVLIQDDLVGRVNNELGEIKDFIRGLPADSRVMVGYITSGTLQVRQDFTTDKKLAADSFRILFSSNAVSPYNPYVEVVEALEKFDSQPKGRRMILLISDGLDSSHGLYSGNPYFSADLDRAVAEAQRRSVAVFTMYAPSVGLTSFSRHAVNYGQGSLLRIANETGGEAFFSGTDFVTFNPYFREYNELLKYQWLITYQSGNTGKGFRRIEVTTDFDIHLHHPAGYTVK